MQEDLLRFQIFASNPKSFHPALAQNYQRFYVLRSILLSKTTEEDKGEDSLGVYLEAAVT